jgi:hypothetical protein
MAQPARGLRLQGQNLHRSYTLEGCRVRSFLQIFLGGTDRKLLRDLVSLGFDGARQGIRLQATPEFVDVVMETFASVRSLAPLIILPLADDGDVSITVDFAEHIAAQMSKYGHDREVSGIEFGNEPNLFSRRWDPEELGRAFVLAHGRIRKRLKNAAILSPSVSDLSMNEVEYARRMFVPIRAASIDYTIAFHRYPGLHFGTHDGLTRDEELARFLEVAGQGRPLWMTETGIPQAQRRQRKFPFCWTEESYRISETEQADWAVHEYAFWRSRVAVLVYYQINDGPDKFEPLDTYGIRRFNYTPKEIMGRFPSIHESVATQVT